MCGDERDVRAAPCCVFAQGVDARAASHSAACVACRLHAAARLPARAVHGECVCTCSAAITCKSVGYCTSGKGPYGEMVVRRDEQDSASGHVQRTEQAVVHNVAFWVVGCGHAASGSAAAVDLTTLQDVLTCCAGGVCSIVHLC